MPQSSPQPARKTTLTLLTPWSHIVTPMANWLALSPESKQKIRQAWERAVVRSATEIVHHLPLIVGGTFTLVVDLVRTLVIPQSEKLGWVLFEYALTGVEGLLILGLVLGGVLDLVGELAERVSVIVQRVRRTWRTGKRPPPGD